MSQYEPMYDSFDRSTHERYVPTPRMNVSSSVYLPNSEVDFLTGMLKPDRARRRRTQGARLERDEMGRREKELVESMQHELSKPGIRVPMYKGLLALAALGLVLGFVLLCQNGQIHDQQRRVNEQQESIRAYVLQNEELSTRIAEASDEATICYAAARNLNMISAQSAEAIHLVALDTRPAQTAQSAAQQQPDSTHAPVSASN